MFSDERIKLFRDRVERELASTLGALSGQERPATQGGQQFVRERLSSATRDYQSAAYEQMLWKKRRLEAALMRLEARTFGLCCQCGDQLNANTLEQDLGAPFCDDCQEEINVRRRAA